MFVTKTEVRFLIAVVETALAKYCFLPTSSLLGVCGKIKQHERKYKKCYRDSSYIRSISPSRFNKLIWNVQYVTELEWLVVHYVVVKINLRKSLGQKMKNEKKANVEIIN